MSRVVNVHSTGQPKSGRGAHQAKTPSRPRVPDASATLQRQAGNRAVATLFSAEASTIQRKDGKDADPPRPHLGTGWAMPTEHTYLVTQFVDALQAPIPPLATGPDVRKALSGRPGFLAVLTTEELDQWQQAVNRQAAERTWTKLVTAMNEASPAARQQPAYDPWMKRLNAKLPPAGPPGGKLQIPFGRFLHPDVMKFDYDVEAETDFRIWAIAALSVRPVEITCINPDEQDLRFASQLLPTAVIVNSDYFPTVFPKEYAEKVTNRQFIVELSKLVDQLEDIRSELDPEFQNRLQKNEKYSGGLAFVRKWSEWLGEGSTDMPDVAEWNAPYFLGLKPATKLLRQRQVELAVPMLIQAEMQMADVADRFTKYERRVMSGAGVAIKWLERVKTAGSLAATLATGPLGFVRGAIAAGAYVGTQSVAQQASEVALGQRKSIDIHAAAKEALITTAMTMITGPIQVRMQARIMESIVGREALAAGVRPAAIQSIVGSAVTAYTMAPYNVAVSIVLHKVIAGQAAPASIDALCNLVLDEAAKGSVMNPIMDKIHADLRAAKTSKAAKESSATQQAKAEAMGAKLAALARDGGAVPAAASHDVSSIGNHADPARVTDPTLETGLTAPDAMKRVAVAAHVVETSPATRKGGEKLALGETATRIADAVAKELPAGMPAPKVVVRSLKSPHNFGSYDPSTNVITVNADARVSAGGVQHLAFESAGGGFERLLGLIYHEARHAEQTFYALRVRAGTGGTMDPEVMAEIFHKEHNVDRNLALAAAKRRIGPSEATAEAKLGREVWAESFEKGAQRDLRNFAQRVTGESQQWREQIETIQQQLEGLHSQGKQYGPEFMQLLTLANEINTQLTRAFDIYFHLAEEIDARRAGFTVEAVYRQIVEAQTDVNWAIDNVRTAQAMLDRLREHGTPIPASSLSTLLQHEAEFQRAMSAFAALMPAADPKKVKPAPTK